MASSTVDLIVLRQQRLADWEFALVQRENRGERQNG